MVREHVKWEYELRHGQPINTIVGRAVDIAMSEPKGPVYLQLPRELLAVPRPTPAPAAWARLGTVPAVADIHALERVADMIAAAENPIIVMTTRRPPRRSRRSGLLRRPTQSRCSPAPHAALSSSNPMNLVG